MFVDSGEMAVAEHPATRLSSRLMAFGAVALGLAAPILF